MSCLKIAGQGAKLVSKSIQNRLVKNVIKASSFSTTCPIGLKNLNGKMFGIDSSLSLEEALQANVLNFNPQQQGDTK